MPKRRLTAATAPIEQEFLDAFARLEAGQPRNPALARRAKLGTLQINCSTLALEARRSRTLIGHERCRYPAVRAKVLAARQAVVEPHTAEEVIRRLREDNACLRRDLRDARSTLAAMVRRITAAEHSAKRELRRARRDSQQSREMVQPALGVVRRTA